MEKCSSKDYCFWILLKKEINDLESTFHSTPTLPDYYSSINIKQRKSLDVLVLFNYRVDIREMHFFFVLFNSSAM